MRTANPPRRDAFTLIELLTVIIIIGMLAAILVPTVTSGIVHGYVTKSRAQQENLADGAESYKQAHRGFYPGQDDTSVFDGPDAKTGSQVLAAALYGFELGQADPEPAGKYVSYKAEHLVNLDGREYSLSDLFPGGKEKAFCYYVYRGDGTTAATKYRRADNDAHTGTAGDFIARVSDPRFGDDDVHNEGRFILIAPGADRDYFTADDVQN